MQFVVTLFKYFEYGLCCSQDKRDKQGEGLGGQELQGKNSSQQNPGAP